MSAQSAIGCPADVAHMAWSGLVWEGVGGHWASPLNLAPGSDLALGLPGQSLARWAGVLGDHGACGSAG